MSRISVWEQLRHGLIVSCQAAEGDPLRSPLIMAALARAVVWGGAVGIRANGAADVQAISQVVDCPIIGLHKHVYEGVQCITPTFAEARLLVVAGASLVAVEATRQRKEIAARERIDHFGSVLERIHKELHRPVMADVSTIEEGIEAARLGADIVATTMSGYTPETRLRKGPDFDLLAALVREVPVPVIAEGRLWTPEQAARALSLGAFAVVVGSAITRPRAITERFVAAIQQPDP
ncbi:MAG TPA: N-acetylmannosamine-6-phosphate 2-epimerase [Chloroflexota bacterium]|nr:N-acetylmannosamine-6-phosphate 2-epimerase [Chloroflexota bacterium]